MAIYIIYVVYKNAMLETIKASSRKIYSGSVGAMRDNLVQL